MQVPSLFVGTAGWSIPTIHAERFSADGTHLQRYARVLNAVEINSSFYRPHRHATYQKWAGSVPDRFRFSVKLPKAITHQARLIGCDALLDRFIDEVTGLAEKLGALLVQLPPSLAFEPDVAGTFFETMRRRTAVPTVCEPRHASWFAQGAEDLLLTHMIGRVAADPEPAAGAGEPGGWPGIVYYRLHGAPKIYHSNYEPDRLTAQWARMQRDRAHAAMVWCIFDNTASYAACGNALDIHDRAEWESGQNARS